MRPIAIVLVTVAAAGAVRPQEPSAKDLSQAPHAEVKAYANDGRFMANFSMKKPEQLVLFDHVAGGKVQIAPGEGLVLESGADAGVECGVREILFKEPFKIALEVKLARAPASLLGVLTDGKDSGCQTVAGVNQSVFSDIRRSEVHPRHHVITTDRAYFCIYRRNKRESIPLLCLPRGVELRRRPRWTSGRFAAREMPSTS